MTAGRTTGKVSIGIARSAEEIRRCHAVMRELRPKFARAEQFVSQVQCQQKQGYLLAFIEESRKVRGVAGYRYLESLFGGRFVYVDDLVTLEDDRSRGFGRRLLAWVSKEAAQNGCERLELDSGVQRRRAHRFYFREGLTIDSFHFGRALEPAGPRAKRSGRKRR